MATLTQIMGSLAEQIAGAVNVDGLAVVPRLTPNPSTTMIDIYPADPFSERVAYGRPGEDSLFFTVRARVSGDQQAEQEVLLDLMDNRGQNSLTAAVESDPTLGGDVEDCKVVDGPSGFRQYADAGGQGSYLGVEWRIGVIP